MIDLHAHVLPGIDDGAATMEEAVEVAATAAGEGTAVLAATPHLRADHPAVHPEELGERTAELRSSVRDAGIGLEIVAGGELDLVWALHAGDEALRLVSFDQAGRDLMIETPYGPLPAGFEELLFAVAARGYRVLLAHPERSPTFQQDTARLHELVRRGTLLQVTAAALVDRPARSRSARLARALVQAGVAHVIASDRHGPDIQRAGLADGVAAARALAGRRADWMVEDAPAAILAGDALPAAPPISPRRRRRLWRG
jgi:protein-tyrosine phosphatase